MVVAAVLQHAVANGTGGGGGGGCGTEAGAVGAMGLGGLAFALGVCMLLCFLGMMGGGLVTTVLQLTRRVTPLSSYLSLIVPLSASEIRCLGLGSSQVGGSSSVVVLGRCNHTTRNTNAMPSQPAAASAGTASEPWRGLGRTVAVTTAWQPRAGQQGGGLESLASSLRAMRAFWLPGREAASSAPPSSAFQRGGARLSATSAFQRGGGGGGGGGRDGGGGRGGVPPSLSTVAAGVHRAKCAWGTQGTTGR